MTHMIKLPSLVEMDAPEAPSTQRGGSPKPDANAQPKGPSVREKLAGSVSGGGAKIAVVVACVLAIGFGAWRTLRTVVGPGDQWPRVRVMNPTTGELKWFYTAPKARMFEGFFPVEYCFEKECGAAGGTPVVLNVFLGKSEDTTCPKCGSKVAGHNPRPEQYQATIPADWSK